MRPEDRASRPIEVLRRSLPRVPRAWLRCPAEEAQRSSDVGPRSTPRLCHRRPALKVKDQRTRSSPRLRVRAGSSWSSSSRTRLRSASWPFGSEAVKEWFGDGGGDGA